MVQTVNKTKLIPGGGRMGELVRTHDWAKSPLGPLEEWPLSLRNAVGLILENPIPQVICWCPGLTAIYNDAYIPLLGGKHPALGQSFLEIWAEASDIISPMIDKSLTGEASYARDFPFTLMRGGRSEQASFDFSFSPLRDDEGAIAGVLNTAVETTSRCQDKTGADSWARDGRGEELVPSGRLHFLETLLDHLHTAVAVMTGDELRYTLVNRAYQGLRIGEPMLGRRYRDVFPGAEESGSEALVQEVLRTGIPYEDYGFPLPVPDRPDSVWYLQIVPLPVDNKGEPSALFISMDVSERRRAESALRQAKHLAERRSAELQAALESAPIAAIFYDTSHNITYMNPTARKMLGFSLEDVQLPAEERIKLFTVHKTDNSIPSGEELVGYRALKGETVVGAEFLITPRNRGEAVHVLSHAAPIVVDGRIIGAVQTIEDITAVEKALKQAEAANRAKSEFLSNMSHEIRTPLNGVMGMIQLALRKTDEPKTREYLKHASQSADHLLDLINDVLDLSKIESGKYEPDIRPFSLREAVKFSVEPFSAKAQEKRVNLEYSVAEKVPEMLLGDPGHLRQVLMNLVNNAVKFTEQGKVEVFVQRGKDNKRKHGVALEFQVRDTGIGVPEVKQDKIFKAFEQGFASGQGKYGGTGLGLTISKRLIEMMSGEIQLKSEEGVGSTFIFSAVFGLPAEEPSGIQGTIQGSMLTGRSLRILLAEDEEVNRLVIVEMLADLGHEVAVAVNGREVLEKLQEGDFDLVLMDIRMPVMSGDQAVKKIRKGLPGVDPNIPVIALSAYALKQNILNFREAGFDGYLTKPVEMEELEGKLAEFTTSLP